ncbi:MAG: lipocalin family protein [Bacteroidia bacterium]
MIIFKNLIYFVLISFYSACAYIPKNALKNQTVKQFNLQNYTGKWYEIARFNHGMEKGLVGFTATYILNNNGTIKVYNEGFKDSLTGKKSAIEGFAKMPYKSNMGYLKVYFSRWFGAPYLIFELDTVNYQYALVGSTFKNFLWVLSRNKVMPEEHLQTCLSKAKKLGYDTSKLIYVSSSYC